VVKTPSPGAWRLTVPGTPFLSFFLLSLCDFDEKKKIPLDQLKRIGFLGAWVQKIFPPTVGVIDGATLKTTLERYPGWVMR